MSDTANPSSDEWKELKNVLSSVQGVYEAPPENVVSGHYTTGAILGNGDTGVTIGGDYNTVAFYISKNNFWTDDAPLNMDDHRFHGVRPITLGGMDIRIGRVGKKPYRIEQDICDADVRITLSVDKSIVYMRSWVAATENLMRTDLWSEGEQSLPVTIETWTPTNDAYPAKRWDVLHEHNGFYPTQAGVDGDIIWASRETHQGPDVRWVARAAIATRLQGADAQVTTDGSHRSFAIFTLKPGQQVRILSAIHGGKDVNDHIKHAVSCVKEADDETVADLHHRHLDWWREYWLKSYVRVYDDPLERYYYGSLYVMGCCSREGKVAPGLMGNWITTDHAMCHSDYHLNYNYQAPFYGLYSGNRIETVMPYYEPVLDYIPEGRWRAQNEIEIACPLKFPGGVRGVLYPVGIGPWGSTPDGNYHNQVSDATFAMLPFVWHYEYTQDIDFLRDKAYPLMKELAVFWEDYLQKDDRGRYVVYAASYEGYQDINPSQDLGFIRFLFGKLIEASLILGMDKDRHGCWQEILDHISEPHTTVYEGTTVYNHAETDEFLVGFTTDNIEWIFPGECLGLGSDPAKLQIARDTIRLGDAWTQGNNVPKVYPQAVRVGYPIEETIREFKSLLKTNLKPNLTLHEKGGGIETAGSIETINTMLLQSHEGFLRLFPVWFPDKPAKFIRLRAKGAFLVSSAYFEGMVQYIDITSEAGKPCRILNPWPGRTVEILQIDAGQQTPIEYEVEDHILSFATGAGRRYRLQQR